MPGAVAEEETTVDNRATSSLLPTREEEADANMVGGEASSH